MTPSEKRQLRLLENSNVLDPGWRPLTDEALRRWAELKIRTLPRSTVRLLALLHGGL